MENYIKNFINNIHPVSEESLKAFYKLISLKKFAKKHEFVSLGELSKNFYVLKSGIARAYIIDEKGKEHTRTLYTPPSTTGNLNSLITKSPSNLIYDCLTDCEVIECNYDKFLNLAETYHDLSIFQYKTLERIYIREESRILDLATSSATERYLKLIEQYPGIDFEINQYHIASYLNISPVQLSRIKKDLLKKQ